MSVGKIVDVGMKFEKWEVIEKLNSRDKNGLSLVLCRCECGTIRVVACTRLTQGHTNSCGCQSIKRTIETKTIHGCSYEKTYDTWQNMMRRCYKSNNSAYKNYGERGIVVCEEWKNVKNFISWCNENPRPEGFTLDRINNKEGYSPSNCKWSSHKEQSCNRRSNFLITYNGTTKTLSQWSEFLEISEWMTKKHFKEMGINKNEFDCMRNWK